MYWYNFVLDFVAKWANIIIGFPDSIGFIVKLFVILATLGIVFAIHMLILFYIINIFTVIMDYFWGDKIDSIKAIISKKLSLWEFFYSNFS